MYEPQEDDTASEVQADEREIIGIVNFSFLRKWLRLLKSELKKSNKAFVSRLHENASIKAGLTITFTYGS